MIKKIADTIFKWYCHPDYYPDIQGDLEELYSEHKKENRSFPQLRYCADVLLLCRPSLIRPLINNSNSNTIAMFQNYFKISLRALVKHKMFAAINIIGLSIGLTSFLLINEYIRFEESYDAFHQDADQLHRVSYLSLNENGQVIDKDAMASYSTGDVLQKELPEIIQHTVSKKFDEITIRSGQKYFKETGLISADSNFLKLFTYQVIHGSAKTMLNEPASIVLTHSRAKAYFGDINPVGKTVEVLAPYKAQLTVTGVIEDTPDNTHYNFDMLLSDKTLVDEDDYGNWRFNNYYVYIKLEKNVNLEQLNKNAQTVFGKFDNLNRSKLDIHPVTDIYLSSDFTFEPQELGSQKVIDFLAIISIFILVVAWVNYVNLSTALAIDRAKEVGLRKVVGAFRHQLIVQFLCEAFIINLVGAILALLLGELLLPLFNQLVGKSILIHTWTSLPFLQNLLIFFLIGTFISGFYPALVLSGFKPISVLKGKFKNSKSGIFTRKGLVVLQFAVSLILIAGTFIVHSQIQFMQSRDIGISIEKVISFRVPESNAETEEEYKAFISRFKAFKDNLRSYAGIAAVGGASNLPGGVASDINSTTSKMQLVGKSEPTDGTTYLQFVDDSFIEVVDMKLVAGRNFDRAIKSDSNAILVNESFFKRFNLPNMDVFLGEELHYLDWGDNYKRTIIGIVADYNRTSLKTQVEPTIFAPWLNADGMVVKLNDIKAIDYIEKTWASFFPDLPFNYSFLSERFARLYAQEQRFGTIFLVFASLAVVIALLGLYGLASFISLQRSKEVGVRKVLGATETQIIGIFYRYFLKLVGLSALFGLPLVYVFMTGWLDNYAYHIEFPWFTLLIALVIVAVLAFITVAYQTSKVARLNVTAILRSE